MNKREMKCSTIPIPGQFSIEKVPSDKDAIQENLSCCPMEVYSFLKEERNNRYTLWNAADAKLNMLLVFNAALWMAFAQMLSSFTWKDSLISTRFFVVGFCVMNLISTVLMLVGLRSRKLHKVNLSLIAELTRDKRICRRLLEKALSDLEEGITVLDQKLLIKHRLLNVALVLSMISVMMLVLGLLIK